MNLFTEADLISFGIKIGRKFAAQLAESHRPIVVELVGDVGAGKTTFTRGIAKGLGVKEKISSPSFTICKRYGFSVGDSTGVLNHYDFYRLDDPGLMSEDLSETIDQKNNVTIIEWGNSVSTLLPDEHFVFHIKLNDDESRTIIEQKSREEK